MAYAATVVTAYTRSNPEPLVASAGERVTVGKRDDEYPGWIWCTDARGRSSWTPERILQIEGAEAVVAEDYSALELTLAPGEQVTVEREESGWAWVTTKSGERGWLPMGNLSRI